MMFEAGERIQVKVEREDVDDWWADDPVGTSRSNEVKREPEVGRKKAGKKKLYKCDEPNCQYSAKRQEHLLLHAAVHSNERPHKCHICQKTFKTSNTLTRHLKLHSEETPFQCDKCERAFKIKGSLIRHKSIHKNRDEWFKCEECDYSCPLEIHFKRHKTVHMKTNPIKCELCDYSCKSTRRLAYHLDVKHSALEPWRCDQPGCQYTTRVKTNMKPHKINIHESKRSFKCEECPRAFNTKSNLKIHSLIHTKIKPFKCQKCQYSSSYKTSLQVHERSRHVNEKKHKCDECGASYRMKDDLEKHQLNHDDAAKKFKCHLCDFRTNIPRYLRRHQLVSHVSVHSVPNSSNGKKCDECGLPMLDQSDSSMHRDAHRPCSVPLPSLPDSGEVIVEVNAHPFLRRVKIELNDDVLKKEIV